MTPPGRRCAVDVELGTVVHAYGIVRTDDAIDLPDTGVGGAGVALLDAGPVSCVFSILPGEAYGDAAWHSHAEDPRWLSAIASEHEAVLGQLVRDVDVLPLRLPGMYRDEVHLHDVIAAQAELFSAVLDALHGHVEWAVHLYLTGEVAEETDAPTSGREYLQQKAAAASRRDAARARRERLVRDAYAAIADLSRQSVANPPQDSALSGRREPMLLNSAHLVCRKHEQLFFDAVDEAAARLAPAGISIEVSGPWAPYNFVELGLDAVGVAR